VLSWDDGQQTHGLAVRLNAVAPSASRAGIARLCLFLVHRKAVRIDHAREGEVQVPALGARNDLWLRQYVEGLSGSSTRPSVQYRRTR